MACAVARARERPLQLEVVEGLVVDGHDEQSRRRHRAAALEALVDGVLLEAGQQAGELGGAAGGDGDQGGDHGHHDAGREALAARARIGQPTRRAR